MLIVTAVAALVPPGPVAVSVTVVLPLSCGVPVIAPVAAFSVAQPGKPVAAQLVTGRFVLSVSGNVLVNAAPTAPEPVCPAAMMGAPSEIVKAINVPASPIFTPSSPNLFAAVKRAVNEPFVVGVPDMAPVVALIAIPAGNPVATHDVAGRFSASVSAIVPEKTSPTLPVKLCPEVMIGGNPSQIVAVASSVPPGPVAASVTKVTS